MKVPDSFKVKDVEKLEKFLSRKTKEDIKKLQKKVIKSFSEKDELLEYEKYCLTGMMGSHDMTVNIVTSMNKRYSEEIDFMPFLQFKFSYACSAVIPEHLLKTKIITITREEGGHRFVFKVDDENLITDVTFSAPNDLFLMRNDPKKAEQEEMIVKGYKNLAKSIKRGSHYELCLDFYLERVKNYIAVVDVNHPDLESAVLEAVETFRNFSKNYQCLKRLYRVKSAYGKRVESSQPPGYTGKKEALHKELLQELTHVLDKYKIELK